MPERFAARRLVPVPIPRVASPAEAPGYRNAATGALTNVGNEGSVWSGSASDANGYYLNFHATWLNPENATNRAHGLPVRCLQAFIKAPRSPLYRLTTFAYL